MKCFVIAAVILATALPVALADNRKALDPLPHHQYSEAQQIGNLTNSKLREVSGMAASRLRPDLLWVANDSGNGALLYAIGLDGRTQGMFHINGVRNRDWEDLASFTADEKAQLLIADVGDNTAKRQESVLYIVEEPDLPRKQLPAVTNLPLLRRIRFVFEDGPRDCEAVAVDLSMNRVLLLSKRDPLPRLYELPLWPENDTSTVIARFLVEITNIPPPSEEGLLDDPIFGRFRSQPTAMDIDLPGRIAVILTYNHAYLYERTPVERWETAFSRSPQTLKLPKLKQAEALCIGHDGHTIFVTSERRPPSEKLPAPLLRMERINDRIATPHNNGKK